MSTDRITAPRLDPVVRSAIAHELRRLRAARHRSRSRIRLAFGNLTTVLMEQARQEGLDEAEATLRAVAHAAAMSEVGRGMEGGALPW